MSQPQPQTDPRDSHRYAVVVAGGAGTRLWPLSRESLPKQMQSLMGDQTLIAETVERMGGVVPLENVYISTTANYAAMIQEHVPQIPSENIIVEPVARGTAAAFALFSLALYERDESAVIFSLASDHAITDLERFQETLRHCYEFIEGHPGHLAMVGITPTRPDTSLGYIKVRRGVGLGHPRALSAEKFVEKPSQAVAKAYVASGDYYWNAAYYCFSAKTLLDAYDDADPRLVEAARRYAKSGDVDDYLASPEKVHEIEVIDSGKYPLAVIPADFAWSDIGTWQTLHRVLSDLAGGSLVASDSTHHFDVGSSNSLVVNPGERVVATVGLENIVVVSLDDVVLVLNKDESEKLPELLEILPTRYR
ncbi:MAG: mannose-phosphate guanylyltransferase [Nocardioidaceae bacterium]|jgi:mannose-1-phosphate guanylyltransferase|nr:mannose-phosphate guanylyltransferase [Nocardioidaceae bacterium]